jgi:hypothetical protein
MSMHYFLALFYCNRSTNEMSMKYLIDIGAKLHVCGDVSVRILTFADVMSCALTSISCVVLLLVYRYRD